MAVPQKNNNSTAPNTGGKTGPNFQAYARGIKGGINIARGDKNDSPETKKQNEKDLGQGASKAVADYYSGGKASQVMEKVEQIPIAQKATDKAYSKVGKDLRPIAEKVGKKLPKWLKKDSGQNKKSPRQKSVAKESEQKAAISDNNNPQGKINPPEQKGDNKSAKILNFNQSQKNQNPNGEKSSPSAMNAQEKNQPPALVKKIDLPANENSANSQKTNITLDIPINISAKKDRRDIANSKQQLRQRNQNEIPNDKDQNKSQTQQQEAAYAKELKRKKNLAAKNKSTGGANFQQAQQNRLNPQMAINQQTAEKPLEQFYGKSNDSNKNTPQKQDSKSPSNNIAKANSEAQQQRALASSTRDAKKKSQQEEINQTKKQSTNQNGQKQESSHNPLNNLLKELKKKLFPDSFKFLKMPEKASPFSNVKKNPATSAVSKVTQVIGKMLLRYLYSCCLFMIFIIIIVILVAMIFKLATLVFEKIFEYL